MKSSLVFSINIRIVVAVALCVALMGVAEFVLTRGEIDAGLERRLMEVSERLAKSLPLPVWNVDYEMVEAIIETEMLDRDIWAIVVTDSLANDRTISKTRDGQWQIVDKMITKTTPSIRHRQEKLFYRGVVLGTVEVYFTEKYIVEDLLERLGVLALKMLLLLILIISLLVFFITKSVSQPIHKLSLVCEKVAHGDYSLELDESRADEIGSLASSFKQMRESVQEKIENLNREITERKRSEKELYRLQNYLGNIVDAMPSLLVGVDREYRVVLWNLEAQRMTGVTSEDAYGQKLLELLPFLGGEQELQIIEPEGKAPRTKTRIHYVIDDTKHFADITIYPLEESSLEGAVVRVDDVTERVKLEEVMVHTEKMLSVAGLAAGMAHEINNPLAGVVQNVQVVQNRLTSHVKKNQELAAELGMDMNSIHTFLEKRDIFKMLDYILDSGKRAVRIVSNMLSFTRKSHSSFIPCDVSKQLDKAIELAHNDFDLKKKYDFLKVKILKEYDDDVRDVPCDIVNIQQAFFNILKNSAQAISRKIEEESLAWEEADPTIVVRVIQVENGVKIKIKDNGIGMEEETRKRIFEPFYTNQPIGKGLGLGLSVSYFIVKENHNGRIEVASLPGKGTTITIYLPQ